MARSPSAAVRQAGSVSRSPDQALAAQAGHQLDAAVRIIQGDAVTVAEHAQRAATGAGEDMHATLAERFGLGHSGAQQQGQQCAAR